MPPLSLLPCLLCRYYPASTVDIAMPLLSLLPCLFCRHCLASAVTPGHEPSRLEPEPKARATSPSRPEPKVAQARAGSSPRLHKVELRLEPDVSSGRQNPRISRCGSKGKITEYSGFPPSNSIYFLYFGNLAQATSAMSAISRSTPAVKDIITFTGRSI
ncbi:hypothetical protein EV426DRAFT_293586 [Tirmania nivea]|nr:hypothetical protein EV426DRAFT_293586 [Tirmania nivea]